MQRDLQLTVIDISVSEFFHLPDLFKNELTENIKIQATIVMICFESPFGERCCL